MFPVLDLAGAARERGRLHGSLARSRVERSIANYANLFEASGIGWAGARRLANDYREVIGRLDPALLEEIRGIAEGAGRGEDEILALNCRTEILPPTFPERPGDAWLAARLGGKADFGECTALAVAPGSSTTGGAILAQNWDWLGNQREALVLLRARREDGSSYLTLTEAGMLAKIGFNDRGFGVCLNILRSEDDGSAAGVPVHVLLRALLDCRDVADAEARIRPLRFGASSNVLCADAAGGRAALELSPSGAYVLPGEGTAFCHTNHFLAAGAAKTARQLPPSLSSIPRLDRIRELVRGEKGRIGVADVQRMLRDESDGLLSISRHPDPSLPEFARVETVCSVVMELGSRVMHVAPDVPTKTAFAAVALEASAALA